MIFLGCKKDAETEKALSHDQYIGEYDFTITKKNREDDAAAFNFEDTYTASGNISAVGEDKISIDFMPLEFLPEDSIYLYQRSPDTIIITVTDHEFLSYPEFSELYMSRFFEGGLFNDDSISVRYGAAEAEYANHKLIRGKKIE